jgi:hypothetical protein
MNEYSKTVMAKPFINPELLRKQPTARRFIYSFVNNSDIAFHDFFMHKPSGGIKKLMARIYKSDTNEWLLNGKYKEVECVKLSILFLTK